MLRALDHANGGSTRVTLVFLLITPRAPLNLLCAHMAQNFSKGAGAVKRALVQSIKPLILK